jgi:hypothetical protein
VAESDRAPTAVMKEEAPNTSIYGLDFFQALRAIECQNPDLPRIGTSWTSRNEPIRLGQDCSMAFAPSAITSAIESATVFCKMRGNPYVELVHWLHQILQLPDSDLHRIIRSSSLDPSRLAKDITEPWTGCRAARAASPTCPPTSKRRWSAAGSTAR